MIISTLILDHRENTRNQLKQLLEHRYRDVRVIDSKVTHNGAGTISELINFSNQANLDLLFINIDTYYENGGLHIADVISRVRQPPLIIFVSKRQQVSCAVLRLQLTPFDYLSESELFCNENHSKPRMYDRLDMSLQHVRNIVRQHKYLSIKNEQSNEFGEMQRVIDYRLAEEILYITTRRAAINTVDVRLVDGTCLKRVYTPLKDFHALLNGANFYRVHNSYLINLDRVVRIKPSDVGVESYVLNLTGCEEDIPISPDKFNDLKHWLKDGKIPQNRQHTSLTSEVHHQTNTLRNSTRNDNAKISQRNNDAQVVQRNLCAHV